MSHASQVITVVVLAIVALIGLAILGPISGVVTDSSAVGGDTATFEPAPAEPVGFDALADANNVRVEATTGNALFLDGNGSYVDDPVNDSVYTDGSWSLAMVAEPSRDGAFGPDDTLSLYAADNETVHLLYETGNWTARYETASGDTAYVEAPADLDGRTAVGATYNATADELRLYVDGSRVDTDQPDATTVPRNAAYGWIGSVDEVRSWNASLSDSRHSAYATDPVQPLPTDASSRLMFNDGRVTTAYYAPGDATLNGPTELVDGVAGPDLVAGDDYLLDTDAATIETTSDGAVADAPVLFVGVGGALAGTADSVIGGIGSAFNLIPILLLGIMATIVVTVVGRLRGGV